MRENRLRSRCRKAGNPGKGEKVLEDTGYSTRVDAGRLDPVRRKMPENAVEVERLGSGKRVDAGHQKSMTSGENRDSERGYSPESGVR